MTDSDTITRTQRIASLSNERLTQAIDDVLEFRTAGCDPNLCDAELRELTAERQRRTRGGA